MKKGRRIAIIAALIIAVAALTMLTVGNRGFLDMYRLYKTNKTRAEEIKTARAEIDSLKAEIDKLKNDTAYIERVAREKLGMARKGEKVFKFVDK